MYPFLLIDLMVNLDATRQMAIIDSLEEEGSLIEGKGSGVRAPSPVPKVLSNPKENGKSTST